MGLKSWLKEMERRGMEEQARRRPDRPPASRPPGHAPRPLKVEVEYAPPRQLNHDDVDSFMEASVTRTSSTEAKELINKLVTTKPSRMRRLNKDLIWIRQEAVRRGVPPEVVQRLL